MGTETPTMVSAHFGRYSTQVHLGSAVRARNGAVRLTTSVPVCGTYSRPGQGVIVDGPVTCEKCLAWRGAGWDTRPAKSPMPDRVFKIREWTIACTGMHAIATRRDGTEARSGLYAPGHPLRWTPTPPEYVRKAAVELIRQRRRELSLPV